MFRNYFKIITRNLWRSKVFSAINIAGLAIGMASCLIILLYLQHELGYDRYNEKADRIMRVTFQGMVQGEKMNEASVMPPVAQTLKADYSEVEQATRLRQMGAPVVTYQEKIFRDGEMAYVDANFFQVFTLPLLQGDAETALQQPHTVIITRTTAERYFGSAEPLGKVLRVEGLDQPLIVTGVAENVPANSHFHFDLFISMAGLAEAQSNSWMTSNFFTYLVLSKGYDYQQLQAKLPQVIEKYLGPQMQPSMGMTLAEFRNQGNDLGLFLQPLTDIHLSTAIVNPLSPGGNIQYIYLFSAIALFILLIACINFMNLSTAGATKRAREVGIRKVMGSARSSLVWQFLIESMVLTAIALGLAVGLIILALPFFNDLLGIELSINPATHPWLVPGLLAVGLITGVLAGSYPAFFLSAFPPMTVLKGKLTTASQTFGLRSGLVVFQFMISVGLVVGTLVVYSQLAYIQNKQLGFDKEQVLVLPNVGPLGQKVGVFREQLARDPRVRSISISGYLPAGASFDNNFFISPEGQPAQIIKTLRYEVDEQYIPTLGMEIVRGRNFSRDFRSDSAGVILNETAAKALGFGKDALGSSISHSFGAGTPRIYRVLGIVKDFHFRSFHEPISPVVMVLSGTAGNIIVKASSNDLPGLLSTTQAHWNDLTAHAPFLYSFLDERFDNIYRTEQKTGLLLGIFAGLTMLVACLGLFGLAMFMTDQRTKEIGVRKVLGASVAGIVGLLAKDFLKLVGLAIVIASPIAYYLMQRWLADFAYRQEMQWWVFAVAGLAAILIAFLTVGFQSVKAALTNPVKSLRSE